MTDQMFTTGAVKDPEDSRDYPIKNFLGILPLPERIDHSSKMMPVRNQGQEGTCVAFAAAAFKEFQEQEGYLSPRFLYDRIGMPTGGAYPREALRTLTNMGVCPESCQQYIANLKISPCTNALDLAKPNKIKGYARLYTIDEIRRSLVENGPFLASFEITDSWLSTKDGVVKTEGEVRGGHAICIVGFDNTKQMLKFRNSWGEGWGDRGYGYISYSDAMKSLWDAWSSVDIPEEEEEKAPAPEPGDNIISRIIKAILEFLSGLTKR